VDSPRAIPVQREWRAQEIDWVFLMKALPHGALAVGIDQAAKRSRAANRARLARGCKPGVPDTYVFWNSVTLWLERKSGSGLSSAQETFRDAVLANGGHWALIEYTEDVEAACRAAGIPLRATLGEIRTRIADQNERLAPKRKRSARPAKASDRMSVAQYHKLHGKGLL
jgi:hypothetical protein